jgi:hypothetical protein
VRLAFSIDADCRDISAGAGDYQDGKGDASACGSECRSADLSAAAGNAKIVRIGACGRGATGVVQAMTLGRREITLLVGILVAGAAWAIFIYLDRAKPELLTYRLCVAQEQKPCPSDTAFVKNTGEDTVARWAQRECAGYKSRRIIINDGPSPDCGCFLADVRCSSD